jgi:Carbon-nitrogen hydrolase
VQQVAEHLSHRAYRQAFVSLWVLGLDGPTLREWERRRGNAPAFATAKAQCQAALDGENDLATQLVEKNPLALLHVLDEHIFQGQSLSAPSLRRSNGASTQYLEGGKYFWLVPVVLNNRRKAALANQPGNLSHWVRHHCVLPAATPHGINVTLQHTQSTVDDKLNALWSADEPSLKIWIAHFDDQATVMGSTAQSAVGDWRATHIEPNDARMASLHRTLDQAEAACAHVVVFPELTIDMAQRALLAQRLRKQAGSHLVMLQAGSFHETLPSEGKTFNTAPLVNAQGRALLTHRKLRPFSKVSPGVDPVTEDISLGDTIHVLATPVGLLTVLICKDFLDDHPCVLTLLSDVPVEWVLVPSFGDEKTIRQHKAHAKAQGQVRTGSHTVLAQIFNNVDDRLVNPLNAYAGLATSAATPHRSPKCPKTAVWWFSRYRVATCQRPLRRGGLTSNVSNSVKQRHFL